MFRLLNIFVSHPSDLITDHRVHGDGAVAYEQIYRLAERGHRLHVAYTSVALAKPLPENVTLHRIDCRLPSSRMQELEYMVRVRRLFQRLHHKQPFDLIHQFHTVFPGRSALLANTGLPLVLGVFVAGWPTDAETVPPMPWHSRVAYASLGPIIRLADRWQQRKASALLLSTPAAESKLYEPDRVRSRCILLWCPGVNASVFTPVAEQLTVLNVPPPILFVGNLEQRKGVFILAEAFRSVWRQHPDVRLVFIGDGTQREALERFVDADGSKKNVQFRGRVSDEEKLTAIRSSAFVVIPSFGEPYGNVATESMACAKPLIVTRAGGLQHLVPPEGGRLVPPRDASALARAMLDLLSRKDQWPKMGEFNHQLALERFDWPRIIDRLEEVYQSVVSSHAPQ